MTPKTSMKPGDVINRLGDALPLIRQICDISGKPAYQYIRETILDPLG